ncbi:MAG: glycerol kinase GlpK [Spirochaetes bacterium]|nr:glycerol kinase GlpK [Spirochaetota bacterium]
MKCILSIDQGTTGNRAIVYDDTGNIITSAYREFPQYFPKPGWVEHNPEEIWKGVDEVIKRVLAKVHSNSIEAIGITNQRETTILWDKNTGIPVYNAIVWQCRRTAERCESLKASRDISEMISKRTGLMIDAYFSASKIEWILKNVPGAMKKAKKGELLFGTTDTWLLWNLTGGKVHATDFTNASRTMLFNIDQLKWDEDILKLFNIPANMLPEVRNSSGVFGYTVKKGNLNKNIPVSGMAGDQQASLFGQTCFDPGSIKNTYGTGSFVLLNTGSKRIVSKNGLITTLGCNAEGELSYVLEGAIFIAGAAIQWLRDQLKIIKSAKESEKMIESLKDNEGVYFVPALVGFGAPYWDPDARGIISGITRGTTSAHLVRAAIEAMCYQTKDVMLAMEKDSGLKINEIKIDGGAVENDFLCQFQADILGIKVIRPGIIETTSLGAAFLAGLGIGLWKNLQAVKKVWKKDKTFSPKMKESDADLLYKGWVDAVNKTLT